MALKDTMRTLVDAIKEEIVVKDDTKDLIKATMEEYVTNGGTHDPKVLKKVATSIAKHELEKLKSTSDTIDAVVTELGL